MADAETIRCPHCKRSFSIGNPPSIMSDETIPIPSATKVTHAGGGLVITRRWFTVGVLPLMFFAIAWDAFLVGWYAVAFSKDGVGAFDIVAFLFPIGHVAAGVGITYSVIAGLLNSTRIEVRSGRIIVKHGPVPWRGNLDRSTGDVDQLYVVRRARQSNRNSAITGMYDVMAVSRDRTGFPLVRSLPTVDIARYIERTIEQRLGLENRPVVDELQG
jgi:hypothetical protein